ncbi:hypothetical protein Patl1_14923 [Pistacia atlantica]|uniref:Uncharacterized protein n=1 Tax=Pistacia atlantica TaxID=434234 RepID=A0ACC1ASA7_9ROSI|nr:hypothetical protein Patl1_14923 [Pistacia atlantica]
MRTTHSNHLKGLLKGFYIFKKTQILR